MFLLTFLWYVSNSASRTGCAATEPEPIRVVALAAAGRARHQAIAAPRTILSFMESPFEGVFRFECEQSPESQPGIWCFFIARTPRISTGLMRIALALRALRSRAEPVDREERAAIVRATRAIRVDELRARRALECLDLE